MYYCKSQLIIAYYHSANTVPSASVLSSSTAPPRRLKREVYANVLSTSPVSARSPPFALPHPIHLAVFCGYLLNSNSTPFCHCGYCTGVSRRVALQVSLPTRVPYG